MGADFYRYRLKRAAWSWREGSSRHQGRFTKDRVSGRADKRGARNDEKSEIARGYFGE